MARKVILDTNFLLIPSAERVDVFAEIERVVSGAVNFCMIEGSMRELQALEANGSPAEKAQARLARKILAVKHISLISQKAGVVDDAIVQEARPGDLVATMDKELRQRLKEKGVDTAVLRKRQHVIILEA